MLDLEGYSVMVGTLSGSGTVQSNGGPATLQMGDDGETSTFTGTLLNNGTDALTLEVSGGATLCLSSPSDFTGTLIVDSGSTLVIGDGGLSSATIMTTVRWNSTTPAA